MLEQAPMKISVRGVLHCAGFPHEESGDIPIQKPGLRYDIALTRTFLRNIREVAMSTVHLHLLLNHIPVVGSLVAVVLFATAFFFKETVSTKFALAFTAAIAVVAVAVYFTGGAAEDAVENLAGVTETAISRHEEAAEMTTIAIGIFGALSALALFMARAKRAPRWLALSGLVGSIAVSGLMAWTANLGGQIRHTEIQSGATSNSSSVSED